MADAVIRRGRDTQVAASKPDKDYAQSKLVRIQSGAFKTLVHLPLPGVRGRTIASATLSVPVEGSSPSQTTTHTPVSAAWKPRETTWNNQPGLRSGQAVTTSQAALSDGERMEFDITASVQAVADGAEHYGWCITTGSASQTKFVGFDAPESSWKVSIDFVEEPEAPSDLAPNGTVVGVKPVLTFDFVDYGGASTEMASVQVRVNTSASSSGAWDSGEVATTLPEFDLAAWSTTPTSGTTYFWQVRVKDGAGYWSDWSDWASFIYLPKPVLTITSPAGGVVWDPTPTITAAIISGDIKAFRVRVAKGTDKTHVIYDSGKQPGSGTTLAHTLPFKQDGKRILKDDSNYWLEVRIWDDNRRQATPGNPTHTSVWTVFQMDDDAVPPKPTAVSAVQTDGGARVRVSWTWAGAPEGWVVLRDGKVVARLDTDEVEADGSRYTWVDPGASAYVEHAWTVKVISGDKQSKPSAPARLTPDGIGGVWLLSDHGDVKLLGTGVDAFTRTDRRATYSPPGLPYDVDVVYALGGIKGTYAGGIDSRRGDDWEASKNVLEAIRQDTATPVQLAYGTVNLTVLLRNLYVLPHPSFQPHNMAHTVSFEAWQVDDFEDA